MRSGAVPPGQRVYAIGDVHGCLTLMTALIEAIRADDRQRGEAETHLVLLGDLVDRGPASAEVVQYLLDLDWPAGRLHLLKGNHEHAMLAALDGSAVDMQQWLRYGGYETLRSYGVSDAHLDRRGTVLNEEMYARIPSQHIRLLRRLADYVVIGDYLFVHAGVRPGVALPAQKREDLYWIREDFLESRADHGFVVVHGHTIAPLPEERGSRVGIDTGAYGSGRLTALRLEGRERGWLWTEGDDRVAHAMALSEIPDPTGPLPDTWRK